MSGRTDKTSDLGHALLGLLARREATGYDLSARLAAPLGYFWTARHSQVYPELARLEAAGLVSYEEIPGRGPRPTKRYAVTAAGRSALAAWVVTDPGEQAEEGDGPHDHDDDGRGFAYPAPTGAGIRDRIVVPMLTVEGRAEVDTAFGHGTTVRLTWGSVSVADVRSVEARLTEVRG